MLRIRKSYYHQGHKINVCVMTVESAWMDPDEVKFSSIVTALLVW